MDVCLRSRALYTCTGQLGHGVQLNQVRPRPNRQANKGKTIQHMATNRKRKEQERGSRDENKNKQETKHNKRQSPASAAAAG